MRHGYLRDDMVGRYRTSLSWIGGTSPLDAAYVAPPADRMPSLMDDLVDIANGQEHDPVTLSGLVHAQFETIHPYGDGNGRLGRVLIGWVLRRRGVVAWLPPPISVLIARDVDGYLAGLWQFREGDPDIWARWFVRTVDAAATATDRMVEEVEATLDRWDHQTADLRDDAAARRALALLPRTPVVNATHLAGLVDVSTRTARGALGELEGRGILEPFDGPPRAEVALCAGGRRPPCWTSPDGGPDEDPDSAVVIGPRYASATARTGGPACTPSSAHA
ncbi:MAG: Fic family protein [Egibacteraceae bacterium]